MKLGYYDKKIHLTIFVIMTHFLKSIGLLEKLVSLKEDLFFNFIGYLKPILVGTAYLCLHEIFRYEPKGEINISKSVGNIAE